MIGLGCKISFEAIFYERQRSHHGQQCECVTLVIRLIGVLQMLLVL